MNHEPVDGHPCPVATTQDDALDTTANRRARTLDQFGLGIVGIRAEDRHVALTPFGQELDLRFVGDDVVAPARLLRYRVNGESQTAPRMPWRAANSSATCLASSDVTGNPRASR
jgi:hypothetical protein